MPARKSIALAYFLWLCGGFFGLHHLYLRRDRHAFVMFTTAGCFGLGFLTDLWNIPEYVRDSNEDPRYLEGLRKAMKRKRKPSFSLDRQCAAILTGFIWGCVFLVAIPEETVFGIQLGFLHYLTPVAIALGVHTVGNIGRIKGGLFWPLIGAYSHLLFKAINHDCMICAAFISVSLFEWKSAKWRRTPTPQQSSFKRACKLSAFAALYISLWASFLYFNLEIRVKDTNESVKLRVVIKSWWYSDWKHSWIERNNDLELTEGLQALKVLGLEKNVTQEGITARWRVLSKTWHPDRFPNEDEKREAEEKFLRISAAYQTLSKLMKAHRLRHNFKSFQELLDV